MKLIIAKYKSREMSFGPREGGACSKSQKSQRKGIKQHSDPVYPDVSVFYSLMYISAVLLCASTYGIGDIQYIGNRDDRPEYSDPRSNYKFCRQ